MMSEGTDRVVVRAWHLTFGKSLRRLQQLEASLPDSVPLNRCGMQQTSRADFCSLEIIRRTERLNGSSRLGGMLHCSVS
jgi:hypothetical protein